MDKRFLEQINELLDSSERNFFSDISDIVRERFPDSNEKEIEDKKIKKDKTIASFEYNGKKGGAKDTTIKFLNYDDNYYRVNIDGDEFFLVSKIEVDDFLNDIKSFDKKLKD